MGVIEILGEYIIDITQCANTPTNGAIFNGGDCNRKASEAQR